MDIWNSASGMVRVELTSADISGSIDCLNKLGVEIYSLEIVSPLCARFSISKHSLNAVERLLTKRGDKLVIQKKEGLYWTIRNFICRPVLLVGLLMLFASALYIPNHIYFIKVEGNKDVLDNEILSAAEDCGISFGVRASVIRSEKVKNQLLDRVPQLQWLGVNTKGCVAVIQVRERETLPTTQITSQYGSIVAARDGIIKQYVVERGNALCHVGQAVKEGDILISGITDCGLVFRYTQAEGEILAETKRQVCAVMPLALLRNQSSVRIKREYGLRIGKNIIKFSKDSGILDVSCAKIYEENYLELPGGFRLPIAWICQTTYYYEINSKDPTDTDVEILDALTDAYLCSQMVGGSILSKYSEKSLTDDAALIHIQYSCLEMIGKKSDKEIIQEYEQTN